MEGINSIEKTVINCDDLEEFIEKGLNLWVKDEKLFKIYIFSIIFHSEGDLDNFWEGLVSKIAYHFQAKIDQPLLDIQKYNIYLFFFIRDKINNNLRYRIEHDKYSTRKIIIDDIGDTDIGDLQIKEIIFRKLFNLKISPISEKKFLDFNEIFGKCFPKIYNLLISIKKDKRIDNELITKLFNDYKNKFGD